MSFFVSACPQNKSIPEAGACRCRRGDVFVATMTPARLRACLAAQLQVVAAHDSAFGACRTCATGEALPCAPATEAFAHATMLVDQLRSRLMVATAKRRRS